MSKIAKKSKPCKKMRCQLRDFIKIAILLKYNYIKRETTKLQQEYGKFNDNILSDNESSKKRVVDIKLI